MEQSVVRYEAWDGMRWCVVVWDEVRDDARWCVVVWDGGLLWPTSASLLTITTYYKYPLAASRPPGLQMLTWDDDALAGSGIAVLRRIWRIAVRRVAGQLQTHCYVIAM